MKRLAVDMQDQEKVEEPKFSLDIEGALKPWYQDTITTEQIAELGGWGRVPRSAPH